VSHSDATAIPVDVEETTIVTIELTTPLDITGVIERKSWYAAGTAIKSDLASDRGYRINVDNPKSVQTATLRVGVQRDGGLGGPLSGTFNGNPFKIDAGWADEINKLFTTIEVKLPLDFVAKDNSLKIDDRDGMTITSVHIVTDQ
jgi:hypothetical protein